MNSVNKTRIVVSSVLVLNFMTLALIFLYPRIEYLNSSSVLKTERQIRQDAGTFDLPNIFADSYRVAYRILDRTEKDAILFLPPETRTGWARSAMLQVLYPRRIFFGDNNIELGGNDPVYRVAHPNWYPEGCRGLPSAHLGTSGAELCRLN